MGEGIWRDGEGGDGDGDGWWLTRGKSLWAEGVGCMILH